MADRVGPIRPVLAAPARWPWLAVPICARRSQRRRRHRRLCGNLGLRPPCPRHHLIGGGSCRGPHVARRGIDAIHDGPCLGGGLGSGLCSSLGVGLGGSAGAGAGAARGGGCFQLTAHAKLEQRAKVAVASAVGAARHVSLQAGVERRARVAPPRGRHRRDRSCGDMLPIIACEEGTVLESVRAVTVAPFVEDCVAAVRGRVRCATHAGTNRRKPFCRVQRRFAVCCVAAASARDQHEGSLGFD